MVARMAPRLMIDGERVLPAAQRQRCLRAVRSVFASAAIGELGVGLTFVDDASIRELNRQWRGFDKPTDVLSFAAHDGEVIAGLEQELGDLVVSVPTAARQARAHGHPLPVELAVLVAHGLLHLCGYDHEMSDEEAREMAELELSVLDAAGVDLDAALIGRSFD